MPNAKSVANAAEKDGNDKHHAPKPRGEPVRGLLLVGLFKLGKAVFFAAAAAVTLHLVHRDIGDMVMRLTSALPLDPDGHFVGLLMDKANLINSHDLRQAGILSISYALCCLVEGVGLILQKVWAEYFTLVLTVGALPLELYEIVHRFTGLKLGVLMVNVAVLVYLVWLLRRKWRTDREARASGG